MPMDIARPISNIYHNKLAIAVDWFVHVDLPAPPLPVIPSTVAATATNTNTAAAGAGAVAGAANISVSVNVSAAEHKAEALIVDTSTPITSSIAAGKYLFCNHLYVPFEHFVLTCVLSRNAAPSRQQIQLSSLHCNHSFLL